MMRWKNQRIRNDSKEITVDLRRFLPEVISSTAVGDYCWKTKTDVEVLWAGLDGMKFDRKFLEKIRAFTLHYKCEAPGREGQ